MTSTDPMCLSFMREMASVIDVRGEIASNGSVF
jgi:hypothetical protein